jgi:predicted small lipoprotein YifL
MRRSLTLIALIATILSVAACGAGEPPQSGGAAPPKESAQGDGSGAAGLSVTTIEGEEVNLGGQGDVTALYFMAGW